MEDNMSLDLFEPYHENYGHRGFRNASHILEEQAKRARSYGSASRQLFCNYPHIMCMIAENIPSKVDLKNFALVNKPINYAVSAKLYEEMVFSRKILTRAGLECMLQNPSLRYVKTLSFPTHNSFSIKEYREGGGEHWNGDTSVQPRQTRDMLPVSVQNWLVLFTQQLLLKMPLLHTFQWEVELLDENHMAQLVNGLMWKNYMAPEDRISSPIRSLTMANPRLFQGPFVRPFQRRTMKSVSLFTVTDISHMFKLESLILNSIDYLSEIGLECVLMACPGLKHLHLSCRHWQNSLEGFCNMYKAAGGQPLHLTTLSFGRCLNLDLATKDMPQPPTDKAFYLLKLVNTDYLKEFTVYLESRRNTAYGTFSREIFPNLQYLNLELEYRGLDMNQHFIINPNFTQQVEVRTNWPGNGFYLNTTPTRDTPPEFGGFINFEEPRYFLRAKILEIDFPNTRVLGLTIWHRQLKEFCRKSLARMSSLQSLYLKTFLVEGVKRLPNTPKTYRELQEAMENAVGNCPTLRYVKFEVAGNSTVKGTRIVRSWTIRPVKDDLGQDDLVIEELRPVDDEAVCPRSFWSKERMLEEPLV